jgi:leucyl/phenylalanyl-tRNA--protein transferase
VIPLPQLDPFRIWFPPVREALDEPNGLLAFGGDLRSQRLLAAYRLGIFPWYNEQPILWWAPNPRAVIFPDQVHISRSLRKILRRGGFEVTMDRAFGNVIAGCADRSSTWISHEMRRAYVQMHELGHAHSVEVWRDDYLVGGLYGMAVGSVFFGESMFNRATDASKIALVYLCGQLQQWNFRVIDCQVGNDHTRSLGAVEIDREHFSQVLAESIDQPAMNAGAPWQLSWSWPAQEG